MHVFERTNWYKNIYFKRKTDYSQKLNKSETLYFRHSDMQPIDAIGKDDTN